MVAAPPNAVSAAKADENPAPLVQDEDPFLFQPLEVALVVAAFVE